MRSDKTYTYFVQRGEGGPVKIGRTTNISKRMAALATACAEQLTVLGVLVGNHERRLHLALADHRLRGEWFAPAAAVLEAAHDSQQALPDAPCEPTPIERRKPSRPDRPMGGRFVPARPKHTIASLARDVADTVIKRALHGARTP